jgi:hypothetical protein
LKSVLLACKKFSSNLSEILTARRGCIASPFVYLTP